MLARPFHGLLAAGLVIVCTTPCPAYATGAGEKQVAASLGWDLAGDGDTMHPGFQAGVETTLGLTDSWAGHGAASMAWQPGKTADGLRQIATIFLGMTYSVDATRWVPLLDLGLSVADLRGDGGSSQLVGPQVGLGVEYLISRRWTLAAFARFDYWALRLRGTAAHPWLASSGLRLGWMF